MKLKLLLVMVMALAVADLSASAKVFYSPESVYKQCPEDTLAVLFAPGRFNIKADGSTDVTAELQRAIDEVKNTRSYGIVFIPEGRYKISRTVYIPASVRLIGFGAKRPEFFLAKKTPGYQEPVKGDKAEANYMFWFTSGPVREGRAPSDASSGTFYSAFSNIDIRIEDGNPYAVALRTHYAQHSFVTNCNIEIGNALAGIYDVGNEIENVRFHGGRYGIMTTKTSPSWQFTMINTSFENQKEAAIKTQEGGLTIIRMRVANTPIAISVDPDRSDKIYMEDCKLENITSTAILLGNEGLSPNQLSMRRIACSKVPVFLSFRQEAQKVSAPSKLYMVNDLSYGLHQDDMASKPVQKLQQDIVPLKTLPPDPQDDIVPLPDMSRWVNVKDFGAVGDGHTDDTKAFQAAIEACDVIYVPQGYYIVSETLTLKPNTALIGLHAMSTEIRLNESTPSFSGPGAPKPILETPKGGTNIVNGIGFNTGAYNYRAVGCKWMAGEQSYMNDVMFRGMHRSMNLDPPAPRPAMNAAPGAMPAFNMSMFGPRVSSPDNAVAAQGMDNAWDSQYWNLWITNGGGGVFKDIWTAHSYSSVGLYISNTDTPGKIYEMSIEHHVRNEVRLDNVANWNIYAMQVEEETREGPFVQPVELQNCRNLFFANLYLFRVIRITTPLPYCIRTWNCEDIEFYNFHNFTQMRFTTDLSLYDVNTARDVRPWEFTRLTITGKETPDPHARRSNGQVRELATGFEYVEGTTTDSKGNVYFCEQRMKRIYKWDASTGKVDLIADYPWQPLSLACDTEDNLLVIVKYYPQPGLEINGQRETVETLPDAAGTTFSSWGNVGFAPRVFVIDPDNPDETVRFLDRVKYDSVGPVSKLILPSHRWRDLHDFDEVSVWKPEYCFVAPDGKTVIPQYYDFVRSSSATEAFPGKTVYVQNEWDHSTGSMEMGRDGVLGNFKKFANTGEFDCAVGPDGNVYIADGYIYVFDPSGNQIGVIDVPERPTSLTFGGRDGKTLFIAARTSLYACSL